MNTPARACLLALGVGLLSQQTLAEDLTLAWDAPPEDGTVEYHVFSRLAGNLYDYHQPICLTATTACRIQGLAAGLTYYFVVRAFAPPERYSADSNEAVYRPPLVGNLAAGVPMPLPLGQQEFSYDVPSVPVIAGAPGDCKPLGIGISADGSLWLRLGLPAFEAPVDVYIGVYAPALDLDIYLLSNNLQWTNIRLGAERWLDNKFGDVATLLGGYRDLPPAIYTLGVAVTPAGRTDQYYLWLTELIVN
jgi:hypothetical protein